MCQRIYDTSLLFKFAFKELKSFSDRDIKDKRQFYTYGSRRRSLAPVTRALCCCSDQVELEMEAMNERRQAMKSREDASES